MRRFKYRLPHKFDSSAIPRPFSTRALHGRSSESRDYRRVSGWMVDIVKVNSGECFRRWRFLSESSVEVYVLSDERLRRKRAAAATGAGSTRLMLKESLLVKSETTPDYILDYYESLVDATEDYVNS
ncbi:hypothetical protein EVAR_58742_1 [Eumeta japonica]|uniref:Uncharacterized protein n=1 Tax=Eumeta variegata TaxID=151549 RepID=A0A4C1YVR4_EUMVA|nr:hypothetical protein EVAR_58742_1 [Eumeta japonica]